MTSRQTRWLALGVLLGACWPGVPEDPPGARVEVPIRLPKGMIELDQVVELAWSPDLVLVDTPSIRSASEELDVDLQSPDATRLQLRPKPRWPEGATVAVDLIDCLETELGEPVWVEPNYFAVKGRTPR